MFEFETQLKRLKHEVLTAVARLSIEENLTKENIEKIPYEIIKGEKARYRCFVEGVWLIDVRKHVNLGQFLI